MPIGGQHRCDVAFKGWVTAGWPPVGLVGKAFLDVD